MPTAQIVDLRKYLKTKPLPAVLEPLKHMKRWVIWRLRSDDGRATKPPYRANDPSRLASSTNSDSWSTYAVALGHMPDDGGVGFVLGNNIGGIDLDKCRDPETGEVAEWAQRIIDSGAHYVELTPSGRGFRIIGYVSGEHLHVKRARGEGSFELYRTDKGRYITVTGHQVGKCDKLTNIDALIDELNGQPKQDVIPKDDRDTSGSGFGARYMWECRKRGDDYAKARAQLVKHKGRAGDWARRVDERQLQRAWEMSVDMATPGSVRRRIRREGRDTIIPLEDFIGGYVPPDYLIDGLLQRGFLYSFTGTTGSGKTSIMLAIAMMVAGLGGFIGEHEVRRGRVLYFAGENPDDVRMRVIAMCDHLKVDVRSLELYFVEGRTSLTDDIERIKTKVAELGGVDLIVVDTARAYFEGDDENDNVQMGDYARLLRDNLTTLLGKPCVVVNTHPPKNAPDDKLTPAGGGAFIAEVDGNLTCLRDGSFAELHWQGKFRGPEFLPVRFELIEAMSMKLKDVQGRMIKTVIARLLDEQRFDQRARGQREDDNEVLVAMHGREDISFSDIAVKLGWYVKTGKHRGEPHKTSVMRVMRRLEKNKLVKKSMTLGRWVLSSKGLKIASVMKRKSIENDKQKSGSK